MDTKESIIKALGWNLSYLHQIELDASLDHFVADDQTWILKDIALVDGFVSAICCEEKIGEVEIHEIQF